MTNEIGSTEFNDNESEDAIVGNELAQTLRLLTICMREMLSVEEAALFLNRTKFSVWKLMTDKQIPYYVFKRRAYFSRSELEDWLKNSGEKMHTVDELDRQAGKILKELKNKRK